MSKITISYAPKTEVVSESSLSFYSAAAACCDPLLSAGQLLSCSLTAAQLSSHYWSPCVASSAQLCAQPASEPSPCVVTHCPSGSA